MSKKDQNEIKLPPIENLMLAPYIPLINWRGRYLNLIGGRGSGKSVAAAQIIVLRMLSHKHFLGVGIRKIAEDIADSIFKSIWDVIEEWGLTSLFKRTKSPMKINCINGNAIIFRGLNKPMGLKSLREVSFVWYEEETCDTLDDFNTIDLTFRTQKAEFIQIMHTLNPVLEGEVSEHWFYKKFGYNVNNGMNFEYSIDGEIEGEKVGYKVRSVHTTYKHNKFLTPEYKFQLESETDEYKYAINTLGVWSQRQSDGRFYKSFSAKNNVGEFEYDVDKHIYIGIDFNLYPYSAIVVYQIEGKRLYQIDEICVNDKKESSLKVALREFAKRYKNHYLNVYVCGDATGKKEDSASEKGFNNYSIVLAELKGFKVQMMVPGSNPSVIARGEFTNEIFSKGYNGLEFFINKSCVNTISDFLYLKADYDGTIKKEMVKNKETGKTYEKYGHTSDSSTYILCELFKQEFNRFKKGDVATVFTMGNIARKNSW
jgi:PBSX family phage terminase large subunit